MSLSQPAVRASAVRDTLAFLDKFHAGSRDKVLELVPDASRRVIEETSRLSWIGIEHDHYTIDGIIQVFGAERAARFWAESIANTVEQPLLKPFVSGVLSLLGHDPARFVAHLPKGWAMVYRDMCEPRFAISHDGRPQIHFESIDPLVGVYDNYFVSWRGVCLGVGRLARASTRVELQVAPDERSAVATFTFGGASNRP